MLVRVTVICSPVLVVCRSTSSNSHTLSPLQNRSLQMLTVSFCDQWLWQSHFLSRVSNGHKTESSSSKTSPFAVCRSALRFVHHSLWFSCFVSFSVLSFLYVTISKFRGRQSQIWSANRETINSLKLLFKSKSNVDFDWSQQPIKSRSKLIRKSFEVIHGRNVRKTKRDSDSMFASFSESKCSQCRGLSSVHCDRCISWECGPLRWTGPQTSEEYQTCVERLEIREQSSVSCPRTGTRGAQQCHVLMQTMVMHKFVGQRPQTTVWWSNILQFLGVNISWWNICEQATCGRSTHPGVGMGFLGVILYQVLAINEDTAWSKDLVTMWDHMNQSTWQVGIVSSYPSVWVVKVNPPLVWSTALIHAIPAR